jgi:hypothetical protein
MVGVLVWAKSSPAGTVKKTIPNARPKNAEPAKRRYLVRNGVNLNSNTSPKKFHEFRMFGGQARKCSNNKAWRTGQTGAQTNCQILSLNRLTYKDLIDLEMLKIKGITAYCKKKTSSI